MLLLPEFMYFTTLDENKNKTGSPIYRLINMASR